MKAVWYDALGPAADVLRVGELPTPLPGPGEVRVRLAASAINPADANRRAGRGHPMEFPRVVPHSDGAGTVDAVGAGADPAWLGRRVWLYFGQRGRAWGTAAQYICLPQELVAPLPDGLDFAQGACLGIPGMTAWCALFAGGGLQGQRVLVTGGAGAVGHYAVQLARWAGARVYTTVSSAAKAAHAWKAQPHQVFDYTDGRWVDELLDLTEGQGVDLVVDVDAAGNGAAVMRLARPGARWVSYAGSAGARVDLVGLIRRNIALQGLYLSGLPADVRRRAQQGILGWLAQTPDACHTVDRVFPLERVVEAHEAVESATKLGTVVVDCN